jgi:hypothetical protein
LLKEAAVVKMVAVHPRIDNKPSKENTEMEIVAIMKSHISFFEVVKRLVVKRAAASNPRKAAVQWPSSMKWVEIIVADTIRHARIFVLFLNWKERISVQMAIPIRIWDRTKLDING